MLEALGVFFGGSGIFAVIQKQQTRSHLLPLSSKSPIPLLKLIHGDRLDVAMLLAELTHQDEQKIQALGGCPGVFWIPRKPQISLFFLNILKDSKILETNQKNFKTILNFPNIFQFFLNKSKHFKTYSNYPGEVSQYCFRQR